MWRKGRPRVLDGHPYVLNSHPQVLNGRSHGDEGKLAGARHKMAGARHKMAGAWHKMAVHFPEQRKYETDWVRLGDEMRGGNGRWLQCQMMCCIFV